MAQPQQPSSKDLEQYREGLLTRSRHHERVIAGVADIADAVNGINDHLPDLDGPLGDNLSILTEGLGKILQGVMDLHSMDAENLQAQATAMEAVIQQAKAAESGIVGVTRAPRPKGN